MAVDNPDIPSSLRSLPVAKWATRMKRGTASVSGTIVEPVSLDLDDQQLSVIVGPGAIVLDFVGGESPRLTRLSLRAKQISIAGKTGTQLELNLEKSTLDSASLGDKPLLMGPVLDALVNSVGDVDVRAEVEPDGDVIVKFAVGVELLISEKSHLSVRASGEGPPMALQLSEPLVCKFGGDGIRLSHHQFRGLARLAKIQLNSAILHPDGSVNLKGGASAGLNRAVRGGLHLASNRISRLIKRSPNFTRVRQFLRRAP